MRHGQTLGQHFLRSEKALAQIIEAAELTSNDTVLEIGPGEGVLTEKLLAHAKNVIAVEKDSELIKKLHARFENQIERGVLTLVEDDIRNFNPSHFSLLTTNYKLIANIPYYITGELLRTFLSAENQPERIVFLVQKEVAERIARSKKESILSLSVKAFGNPQYIATVPRGAFSPPPSVDSAILLISDISRKKLENIDENRFFQLVRAGFSSKRKYLKRNIEKIATKEAVELAFENANIDQKARAEDISLQAWLTLARLI